MANREKLIELVGQVQDCGCDVTDVVEMNYVENSVLVDHLIANGVTVRERGRWEKIAHYPYYCSICGEIAPLDFEGESHYKSNFCPNCGADMRGEEDA